MNTPWGLLFTGRNEVVAKVMFLHVCVILFTGGSPGRPPWDQADTPLDQADTPRPSRPPRTRQGEPPPDQADTPPPDQADPPGPGRPPRTRQTPLPPGPGRHPSPLDQADPPDQADSPPPWKEDCSIRSMSGRYASYWNAFFFSFFIFFGQI